MKGSSDLIHDVSRTYLLCESVIPPPVQEKVLDCPRIVVISCDLCAVLIKSLRFMLALLEVIKTNKTDLLLHTDYLLNLKAVFFPISVEKVSFTLLEALL
ncbi:hypothetical protein chiPu_0009597 [Chiloscyllium punctatum]|uniref:Uncharacterized protein n=1 Tax=Chiloscyllium punctatum TaxID=137246 RepID=A0A401SL81_CHIPU|nr:hypothetical protein [Chiloscyllium punctatum]